MKLLTTANIGHSTAITDDEDRVIAIIPANVENKEQWGAEIVKRFNAHEPMVAALTLLDELDWCIGYELTSINHAILQNALDKGRAALALAKEGKL